MNTPKKYKIGILGAGQLGTFIADACSKRLSEWCLFYEKDDDPGSIKYKSKSIKLSSDVLKRAKQLENCEVIILESEFYPYEELKKINSRFIPDIESYRNFYGKINQRKFYNSLKMSSPKHWIISDISELDNIDIFPVIMKKDLFSYDGNGNRECKTRSELHRYAMELGLPLLIEEKLKLKSEFAVGIVSNGTDFLQLPLTETFQKEHICHYVIGPYQIDPKIKIKLEREISKLKNAKLFGLYAFEFFITTDDELIINEGAARPHNSQHLTMNLCDHSQFDYIVDLAIDQSHLIEYKLIAPMGAMINLLGKSNSIDPKLSLIDIPAKFPFSVYMYGKKVGRVGRKLGHLNILNTDNENSEFTQLLDQIYEGYQL